MKKNKKIKLILLCILLFIMISLIIYLIHIISYKPNMPDNITEPPKPSYYLHNEQFYKYVGTKVLGSYVKELYTTVITNNTNKGIIVSINGILDEQKISEEIKKIETQAEYTVEITKYNDEGYVTDISVKLNEN